MSKQHSGLYVDTGLLRDHVAKLREEKKLASRLYENIAFMKAVADPSQAHQYDSLLRDIEQMMDYFGKMATLLAEVAEDATVLSRELKGMIEDSTQHNQQITDKTFLL